MDLQFQKSAFSYLNRVMSETQNQEQTQEIRLPDSMADAGRILAAFPQVILRGKEWRTQSVSCNGGVMVWVLFLPENGTNPCFVDTWIPFQMRWELPDHTQEGSIHICVRPRFADARIVSPRKIMVRCSLTANMETFSPAEGNTYTPDIAAEDVQLLNRSYPVRLWKEAGEKDFQIDEILSLPDIMPAVESIVYNSVTPEVTESSVSSDRVIFRGNANLHILYADAAGQLHTFDHPLEFSQLGHLKQYYGEESDADVTLAVTGLETNLQEDGKLHVKCGLTGQYLISDRQMLNIVEDAYSPCREIKPKPEEGRFPCILDRRIQRITAKPADKDPHMRILDFWFHSDQADPMRTEEGVSFQLSGQFGCIFYGEDGSLQLKTIPWQEQYSIPADINVDVVVRMIPTSIHGDEMDHSGAAELRMEFVNTDPMIMVSGLEMGEKTEASGNRPSLILRRAGMDSLWTIAKSCGSTMDAIRTLNQIDGEPDKDKMLLIPVM